MRSFCTISITKRHINRPEKTKFILTQKTQMRPYIFDFKLRQTDWNTIFETDKKEIDTSFNNFNNLLQQHASLKELSNRN